ncbi:MAG: diaminopropionate ammonia-lyase, partial [Janthinobacterium lividum]
MNALPLGEGSFARLLGPVMMRWLVNGNHGAPGLVVLPAGGFRRAKAEITAWAEYLPTPLVPLPGLAEATSLEAVAIKDESRRLGLGNAEVLGGAYAVGEVVKA